MKKRERTFGSYVEVVIRNMMFRLKVLNEIA